jgi:nitroreductase
MTVELIEVIKKRRSIRKFKSDKIPKKDIYDIIQAASLAPSAHNKQMWRFIAISNQEVLKGMEKAIVGEIEELNNWPELKEIGLKVKGLRAYSTFFVKAPLVFAILVEPYHSMVDEVLKLDGLKKEQADLLPSYVEIQSVAAAVENLLLAATEKGYGTCWMCGPLIAVSALEEILKIEKPWKLMALIPLGLPDQELKTKLVKDIEEILEFMD